MKIDKFDVWMNDHWINVDGIGQIGLYLPDEKAIGLDYSMKWIVGTNERIPCSDDLNEIRDKIVELFNSSK